MTKRIDYAGVVLSLDPEQEERKQIRSQLQWDYGQVPALHRRAVEDAAVEIAVNGRKMTASVMAVGDALIRVKGLLAHGQFEEWCRVEFGMSERTAQNMMNVARTFAGKSAKISLLSDSTLYLLAAPSTPEPVREAVIAQAEASGRSPSVAEVKKAIRSSGGKPPMTPEAKELAREIKAATWGDKPYAEVWEIQNALGRWQHTLNATGLRNLARFRGGADWFDCRVALGELRYRDRDLVQALNNLASIMEQRTTAPATDAAIIDDAEEETLTPPIEPPIAGPLEPAPAAGKPLMQVLATDEERQIEAGIAAMDEAERQALAASDLQVVQTAPAAPTERIVSVREEDLKHWWSRLMAMISDLHNWGNLTGRFTATGEAERGLRKMLEITQRELAILRGEVVEGER